MLIRLQVLRGPMDGPEQQDDGQLDETLLLQEPSDAEDSGEVVGVAEAASAAENLTSVSHTLPVTLQGAPCAHAACVHLASQRKQSMWQQLSQLWHRSSCSPPLLAVPVNEQHA